MTSLDEELKAIAEFNNLGYGNLDMADPEIRAWLGLVASGERGKQSAPPRREPADDERTHAMNKAKLAVRTMRDCSEGDRNDQLNRSAFLLGTVCAGGFVGDQEAMRLLREAAIYAGLADNEIIPTMESGFNAGFAAGWDGNE